MPVCKWYRAGPATNLVCSNCGRKYWSAQGDPCCGRKPTTTSTGPHGEGTAVCNPPRNDSGGPCHDGDEGAPTSALSSVQPEFGSSGRRVTFEHRRTSCFGQEGKNQLLTSAMAERILSLQSWSDVVPPISDPMDSYTGTHAQGGLDRVFKGDGSLTLLSRSSLMGKASVQDQTASSAAAAVLSSVGGEEWARVECPGCGCQSVPQWLQDEAHCLKCQRVLKRRPTIRNYNALSAVDAAIPILGMPEVLLSPSSCGIIATSPGSSCTATTSGLSSCGKGPSPRTPCGAGPSPLLKRRRLIIYNLAAPSSKTHDMPEVPRRPRSSGFRAAGPGSSLMARTLRPRPMHLLQGTGSSKPWCWNSSSGSSGQEAGQERFFYDKGSFAATHA
mmetsp:Transcript_51258/g.83151  ORF Transcript_51258/g.83151 Transcript_51258/m.83151 type:complete len:387 (-) Transcript_51258:308-1468(-)